MSEKGNWRSPPIDDCFDILGKHRDLARPRDASIITDESVLFLDLLAIGLAESGVPMRVFRFDGRSEAQERDTTKDQFLNWSGLRVLLATRATGGQGLNLQASNVVIQCVPWWKVAWEEQMIGRCYRKGQTRPVYHYIV